jgi:hypothetical protein
MNNFRNKKKFIKTQFKTIFIDFYLNYNLSTFKIGNSYKKMKFCFPAVF